MTTGQMQSASPEETALGIGAASARVASMGLASGEMGRIPRHMYISAEVRDGDNGEAGDVCRVAS